jgi:uncharacterized membrane protein
MPPVLPAKNKRKINNMTEKELPRLKFVYDFINSCAKNRRNSKSVKMPPVTKK